MKQKISERKHLILVRAIEEYIKDASPITSGAVQEKFLKGVSTATLRNELGALEAMGYFKQLHTSGGRIPTTQGYRYYVDFLMSGLEVNDSQLEGVRDKINNRVNSLEDVVSQIAKIVSKATNYPTIVLVNGVDKLVVQDVRIIPLIGNDAMVLIKTASGYVNSTIAVNASEEACYDASNYLSKTYTGYSIGEMLETMPKAVEECKKQIKGFKSIVENLTKVISTLIKSPHLNISSGGSAKLLAESNQLSETKKILSLLENEEQLTTTLEIKDEEQDMEIIIADTGEAMEGCALVKAPIKVDGRTIASIGVVGPQRMNYASIASALKIVTTELDNLKGKRRINGKEKRKEK